MIVRFPLKWINPMHFDQLTEQWPHFVEEMTQLVLQLFNEVPEYPFDHAAVRLNSNDAVDALVASLAPISECLSNKLINGRPILLFRLHRPLYFGQKPIDLLEVPYPGKKLYPKEGWEHVEMVFPCNAKDTDTLVQSLQQAFPRLKTALTQPKYRTKVSQPSDGQEALPNPTLAIKSNEICFKIHPYSLSEIIGPLS